MLRLPERQHRHSLAVECRRPDVGIGDEVAELLVRIGTEIEEMLRFRTKSVAEPPHSLKGAESVLRLVRDAIHHAIVLVAPVGIVLDEVRYREYVRDLHPLPDVVRDAARYEPRLTVLRRQDNSVVRRTGGSAGLSLPEFDLPTVLAHEKRAYLFDSRTEASFWERLVSVEHEDVERVGNTFVRQGRHPCRRKICKVNRNPCVGDLPLDHGGGIAHKAGEGLRTLFPVLTDVVLAPEGLGFVPYLPDLHTSLEMPRHGAHIRKPCALGLGSVQIRRLAHVRAGPSRHHYAACLAVLNLPGELVAWRVERIAVRTAQPGLDALRRQSIHDFVQPVEVVASLHALAPVPAGHGTRMLRA